MGFSCPEGGLGIGSLSALLTGLDGGVGVEVEVVYEKDGMDPPASVVLMLPR